MGLSREGQTRLILPLPLPLLLWQPVCEPGKGAVEDEGDVVGAGGGPWTRETEGRPRESYGVENAEGRSDRGGGKVRRDGR